MLTPQGQEIKLNTIMYSVIGKELGNRWKDNWTGRGHVIIRPLRVINFSNQYRKFTVRSAKGCEETFTLKDSCFPSHLTGTLQSAKKLARKEFNKDIDNIEKKIKEYTAKLVVMKKTLATLKKNQVATSKLKPTEEPKRI